VRSKADMSRLNLPHGNAGLYEFPEHIRQSTSIAVFKRSPDISTPADIAPSALQTIIFYCFMGYISALIYYLLLLQLGSRRAVLQKLNSD